MKKIGKVIWGIVYVIGGIVGTICIMPFIIFLAIINLIKK